MLSINGKTRIEEVKATSHRRERIFAIIGLVSGFSGFVFSSHCLFAAILFLMAALLLFAAGVLAVSTGISQQIPSTVNFTLPNFLVLLRSKLTLEKSA